MISNTSARQQVSAIQLAEDLVEEKQPGCGCSFWDFFFYGIFTCYVYTANAEPFGLAVKNKLGVLWWERALVIAV